MIFDELLVMASTLICVASAHYFRHFREYFARSSLLGVIHDLLVEFDELYVLQFFPARPFTFPTFTFQQGFRIHSGDLVTCIWVLLGADDGNWAIVTLGIC